MIKNFKKSEVPSRKLRSCSPISLDIGESLNQTIKNIKLSEINIEYRISRYRDIVNIFGEEFVKRNKNKCILIINEEEHE